MCNYDYLKQEVENNDLLYVDSCSTMEHEGFRSFISNIKELLVINNKKIKIIAEVYCELIKHSCSSNIYKQQSALNALAVIKENSDVFEIECEKEANIDDTFADPKLLAHLLNNIASQKQLLITNDRKLSSDAYNFNNLNSINGRKIHVCYINRNGDMLKCNCVNTSFEDKTDLNQIKESQVIKTVTYKPSFFEKFILPSLIGITAGIMYEKRKKLGDIISSAACDLIKIFA